MKFHDVHRAIKIAIPIGHHFRKEGNRKTHYISSQTKLNIIHQQNKHIQRQFKHLIYGHLFISLATTKTISYAYISSYTKSSTSPLAKKSSTNP